MPATEAWIVELRLNPKQAVLFQSLLQGEDGLAVMRCFDPAHRRQQLWTTRAQREDLLQWLQTMRGRVDFAVERQWPWREDESDARMTQGEQGL